MHDPTTVEEMSAVLATVRESATSTRRACTVFRGALAEIQRRAKADPAFTGEEAAEIASAALETVKSHART